ncbi:hypothetical protein ACFYKX_25230 [Cytobacillus sp. FJAT-54145]|uniref:Flp pilus-assembly TadG-like N-terminal domain-containing protein n=1 Tax=Cytobacillus spartinae TaxID=3299023 RepID=A0ABW6KI71_9BACI
MNYVKDEKGNAAIFMLWLLGMVAIVFILTINIVKVYIVKEHASLSVEQAAIAGTAALLERTKKAVENYDTRPTSDLLYIADRNLQISLDGASVGQLIESKKNDYMANGMDEGDALVKAVNKLLPERINRSPYLKWEMRNQLGLSSSDAYHIYTPAIMNIIADNKARTEDTEPTLSTTDWRIEVKSTVRFKSIADNKFITAFIDDLPQRGYGPKLIYLEDVYTGTIVFPTP